MATAGKEAAIAVLVPWHRSFVFRVVGMFVALTVAVVLLATWQLRRTSAADIERTFGRQLEAVAGTAAPFVASADLYSVAEQRDASSPEFRRTRAALERVRRYNGLEEDQVYILRRRADGETFEFLVMLQERTFIGDVYTPPEHLARWYRLVRERGQAEHTAMYTDEHGSFVSGLAPIRDPTGQVVAILQIDRDVREVLDEVDRRSAALLAGGALVIFVILLGGVWTHRRIRVKTLALLHGTWAIEREEYDHHVLVKGEDELAAVAGALNRVIAQLKERFTMLKFLPEHTRKMISDARDRDVNLSESRRVRVVVLESDIRGFSRISEALSPEATIGMLNTYIRVQAEHITSGGGSIDKYMGDAVLAVFEGEGMEARALSCALEIQRTVERMNDEQAFTTPIHIGVGLSVGEVVMGNMGSEDRMEHTVIGAVVNLAARLCSAAGGGEVVATEELFAKAEAPQLAHEREELRLKGFESAIACVRLRA